MPNSVTATPTKPLATPLNVSGSKSLNLPWTSYKVTDLLLDTALLMNAVAPVCSPFTKVGTFRVVASLRVSVVNVWTSNNEISHSLILPLEEL